MNIVTLTLSPAFDVHCRTGELMLHKENHATVTDRCAGGKGVNVSRALAAFGVDSTAVTVLGKENSIPFVEEMERDSVSLLPVFTEGSIRENLTVHTEDGRETRISFGGAAVSASVFQEVQDLLTRLCTDGSILAVMGSIPDGASVNDVKSMLKSLKAKGVRIVIDSRSFTLDDLIETAPFLIKPNEQEIFTYMNVNADDRRALRRAAEDLHQKGIENVMISLGAGGALLVSESGCHHAAAPTISPLSTIGAGDSAVAGFLMGLSLGEDSLACLRRAVALGSAACLVSGTRPPKKDEAEWLLSQITVTSLE